ncbi:MAG: hypothetical protein FWF53_01485 [Candidatus Azobacteroides sp.]|nr:hypothetical protein [Candidatus Azobacteroides sp.]
MPFKYKTKKACKNAGENISYHFADVSKTMQCPKVLKKRKVKRRLKAEEKKVLKIG